MRLIDLNGNTWDGSSIASKIRHDDKYGAFITIGWLYDAPTIDAEPVRHGHWRLDEVGNAFYSALCSCCGKYSYQAIGWGGNVTLPYCSWCGAKMDEVSE